MTKPLSGVGAIGHQFGEVSDEFRRSLRTGSKSSAKYGLSFAAAPPAAGLRLELGLYA